MMEANATSVQIFLIKVGRMLKDSGGEQPGNGYQPGRRRKRDRQTTPRAQYPTWSSDIGFVPRGQPLPFREAVRQLPQRYRFVLTRPGLEPFLPELGLAEWRIVWFQLLGYTGIATLLAFLHTLLFPAPADVSPNANGLSNSSIVQAGNPGSSLGLLLLIPLLFFVAMGVLYGLARAFGGHGSFVQQVYTTLLFFIPCGVLVSALSIIPFAGSFLSAFLGIILFLYCIVLQCFATVAVHQVTGGKATAATIITALVLIPVAFLCLALWALLLVAFS